MKHALCALAYRAARRIALPTRKETQMNNIIYLVGLVVVVIAILSFFGLR